MRTGAAFVAMLVLAALGAVTVLRVNRPEPAIKPSPTLVLAGHPATLGLAYALAAGTTFEIAPAWLAGTPWNEQAEQGRQSGTAFQTLARRAAAVVTLRHAAPDDALFAAARAVNPRIVEIDASVVADQRTPNVRLRTAAGGSGPSFALSPTNAIRLAERIAADFSALRPDDAARLAENLRETKERLVRLQAKFEQAFVEISAPEVVAFTGQFDYLLEEFGVQVLGRIPKDEALWTEADRASAAQLLERSGTRVAVHGRPVGNQAAALLTGANMRLVVLNPQTNSPLGSDDYFRHLEESLAALHAALSQSVNVGTATNLP